MSKNDSPMMDTSSQKFKEAIESIKRSDLFDGGYYYKENKDIKDRGIDPLVHYLFYGYLEGRNPSAKFDNDFYLNRYGDVKRANVNPLIHYVYFGEEEGRVYRQLDIDKEYNNSSDLNGDITNLLKPANSLEFMDNDTFDVFFAKDEKLKDMWNYYDEVIGVIRQMGDISKVLEINPYKIPLVKNCDVLDSTSKYIEEYPFKIYNFYLHRLNKIPFPFEDKRYDLVILDNDFDNMDSTDDFNNFFKEIKRISKNLLIALPFDIKSKNNSINLIDEKKLDNWLGDEGIIHQSIGNGRIIRVYSFN